MKTNVYVDGFNMQRVQPLPGGETHVEVWKPEEKGSDVNLAAYLLLDAFEADCEAAVVISNDSDLAEPMYLARKRLGIRVVVLHPRRPPRRPSTDLKKAASKSLTLDVTLLSQSQFAPVLARTTGPIVKPACWDEYVWCRGCDLVHKAAGWVQAGRSCAVCSSSTADAWSVGRLRHPQQPLTPQVGRTYSR